MNFGILGEAKLLESMSFLQYLALDIKLLMLEEEDQEKKRFLQSMGTQLRLIMRALLMTHL